MYGTFSDEMDTQNALQIGLFIGLIFIVIGFFSGLSKPKRDWEGVVIDKKVTKNLIIR